MSKKKNSKKKNQNRTKELDNKLKVSEDKSMENFSDDDDLTANAQNIGINEAGEAYDADVQMSGDDAKSEYSDNSIYENGEYYDVNGIGDDVVYEDDLEKVEGFDESEGFVYEANEYSDIDNYQEETSFEEGYSDKPVFFEGVNSDYDFSNDSKHGFGAFLAECASGLVNWIKKNKIVAISLAGVIVIVLVTLLVIKVSHSEVSVSSNGSTSQNVAVSDNDVLVPNVPFEVDAYPEVNDFITRYYAALIDADIDTIASMRDFLPEVERAKIIAKSEYFEDFCNIVCYTKPGPFENSYVVYVSYDVKLYNWDLLAPSLLTVLLCSDENGELYMYTGDADVHVADYLREIHSQDDVVDLMNKISANYKEVLDSNKEFGDYITALNDIIRDEAAEFLSEATSSESENEVQQDEAVSENETADTEETETFEVKTTDTVNVRVSDSELADKLGKVAQGTILTCYEQRPNGWSMVDYEGEIGYIKTEYLITLEEVNDADSDAVIGSVKILETVNVRSSASTDSSILGTAYMGETYDVLEEDKDGWTKIIYNGKEAYVKTEYTE